MPTATVAVFMMMLMLVVMVVTALTTLVVVVVVLVAMFVIMVLVAVALLIVVMVVTAAIAVTFVAVAATAAVVLEVSSVIVVDDHFLSLFVLMFVTVLVAMVMMVMAVALLLIDLIQQPAVVDRMIHGVVELVLIDIEHCRHECEVYLVLRGKLSVLLHSVGHVGQIQCDPRPVVQCDRGLDVSQEHSGLGLYPFSDIKQCIAKSGLGIRIPATDPSGNSGSDSVRLFKRCLFSAHFIIP